MKILIITYSREVNPGTFLQAYGVQYAFGKLFPDAQIDLLKHKRLYSVTGKKNIDGGVVEKIDFAFLKGKALAIPRRLKYEFAYKAKFDLTEQEYGLFEYDENDFRQFAESYDLIVVGSDTILTQLRQNERYGLMWLLGIDTNKVLFAASAAPANYDLTSEEQEMLYDSFSSFKMLGVRDNVTFKLLSAKIGLGNAVNIMFDPTFLIPSTEFSLPSLYRHKLERIRKYKKIALVNFGNKYHNKQYITELVKGLGYYTISTLYNQWTDCNLVTCKK